MRPPRHGDASKRNMAQEYKCWVNIKQRCSNPNNDRFKRYAGLLCERWANSYEDFLADVGRSPSPEHSLDRIDNEKGYEPGNVRWATMTEQTRNTRRSRFVNVRGLVATVAEWSELLGVPYHTLHKRLTKYGWSAEKAVFP